MITLVETAEKISRQSGVEVSASVLPDGRWLFMSKNGAGVDTDNLSTTIDRVYPCGINDKIEAASVALKQVAQSMQ